MPAVCPERGGGGGDVEVSIWSAYKAGYIFVILPGSTQVYLLLPASFEINLNLTHSVFGKFEKWKYKVTFIALCIHGREFAEKF